MVGLGLIGLGTVGTGVVKIIQKNNANIAKRVGSNLHFADSILANHFVRKHGSRFSI